MRALDFLRANEKTGESQFLKQAQYLQDNWSWLKYSYAVSIRVQSRMENLGWTQKQLAEALGCTQQHVSALVNGRCNMTLETLAKLEMALDMDLLSSIMTGMEEDNSPYVGYLSDSGGVPYDDPIATKHLVAGYQPRKKKGPKSKK